MSSAKKFFLSLQQLLTIPYVLLVLGVAFTIVALSYVAGSRAVETVTSSLLTETSNRIGQAVDRHIVGSAAVLEAAFPDGMPVKPNIESEIETLRTRFWIATSLHRDPNNYVYYGNRQGQVFGLYRLSENDGELRMKLDADANREFLRFSGINGVPKLHRTEEKKFDPRQRPWYKASATKEEQTWTSVYIDFSSGDLVATRARRVLGPDKTVEGVVATDVSLRGLNDFVSNLKMSANGVALIIEPSGELIAASNGANVAIQADGSKHRINAAQSNNALTVALYSEAKKYMSTQNKGPVPFSFKAPDGHTFYAAAKHLTDAAGLSWITVVAMPRDDFMAGVTENLIKTAVLSLLAALIAVAIGSRILGWVSKDLKRLSTAAQRVGAGELDAPLDVERDDEIGHLAKTFQEMQKRLLTDELTGLANREAFTLRMNRRTQQALRGISSGADNRDQFAVLFIDLNQFKQVNDFLGHDVGDKVLIETGQRLQTMVGPNDLVARLSGDEFAILLNDVNGKEELEKFRISVFLTLGTTPECLKGTTLEKHNIGGSVGQALFPEDGIHAPLLLKKADRRMYRQKFSRRTENREGFVRRESDVSQDAR
jgi:diguanylate cyclase (GGDEF)-like protein